jgi:hypothetical protein
VELKRLKGIIEKGKTLMRTRWIIPVLMLALGSTVGAQSLIGLPKEEVSRRISMYHKDFRKDNLVVSQYFNYLKYVNGTRSRTWILYFNEEDICHLSKLVCDYEEYDDVMDDLNSRFRKVDEFSWEHRQESWVNQISLSKQEYYFTVRETRRE